MSYGRMPYYIYHADGNIRFEGLGVSIPDEAINQFLYVMLKDNKREELKRRVKKGREKYLEALEENEFVDIEFEKGLEEGIIKDLLEK